MALNEQHRSSLFQSLSTLTGDPEAVAEMMSYFPAREVEEPATKEFVRAENLDVRADFAGLRADFAGLRAEFADLRAEFAELQSRTDRNTTRLVMWIVGVNMAQLALIVSLLH